MSVSNEFQAQDMQLQPAGSFVRAKNVACRRRQGGAATAHTAFFYYRRVYKKSKISKSAISDNLRTKQHQIYLKFVKVDKWLG